jgi:hypothetical protein
MLNIKKLANGDIELSLDKECDVNDLQNFVTTKGYWKTYADLFEPYSSNGSYAIFDGSEGNPFIGLWCGPCIADCISYDDDGKASIDGDYYYFNDYETRNDLQELIEGKSVVYTLVTGDE